MTPPPQILAPVNRIPLKNKALYVPFKLFSVRGILGDLKHSNTANNLSLTLQHHIKIQQNKATAFFHESCE